MLFRLCQERLRSLRRSQSGRCLSWDGECWRDNCVSAVERPHVIRKQSEEEVKEGLTTKVSVKKAREEWEEHLVVASLGAVEKNRGARVASGLRRDPRRPCE